MDDDATMKNEQAKKNPIEVTAYGENDVICFGFDRKAQSRHPGNQSYCRIIKEIAVQQQGEGGCTTNVKAAADRNVRVVEERIRAKDPPGRFLGIKQHGELYVLEDEDRYSKIEAALYQAIRSASTKNISSSNDAGKEEEEDDARQKESASIKGSEDDPSQNHHETTTPSSKRPQRACKNNNVAAATTEEKSAIKNNDKQDTAVVAKKRGRPPKSMTTTTDEEVPTAKDSSTPKKNNDKSAAVAKRRGRPPKSTTTTTPTDEEVSTAKESSTPAVAKKRGRPPKSAMTKATDEEVSTTKESSTPKNNDKTTPAQKRRGRPPKSSSSAEANNDDQPGKRAREAAVSEYTDTDVVGHGFDRTLQRKHPGNKFYCRIVRDAKRRCHEAGGDEGEYVSEVENCIFLTEPPGRFLEMNPENGEVVQVSKANRKIKIKQALKQATVHSDDRAVNEEKEDSLDPSSSTAKSNDILCGGFDRLTQARHEGNRDYYRIVREIAAAVEHDDEGGRHEARCVDLVEDRIRSLHSPPGKFLGRKLDGEIFEIAPEDRYDTIYASLAQAETGGVPPPKRQLTAKAAARKSRIADPILDSDVLCTGFDRTMQFRHPGNQVYRNIIREVNDSREGPASKHFVDLVKDKLTAAQEPHPVRFLGKDRDGTIFEMEEQPLNQKIYFALHMTKARVGEQSKQDDEVPDRAKKRKMSSMPDSESEVPNDDAACGEKPAKKKRRRVSIPEESSENDENEEQDERKPGSGDVSSRQVSSGGGISHAAATTTTTTTGQCLVKVTDGGPIVLDSDHDVVCRGADGKLDPVPGNNTYKRIMKLVKRKAMVTDYKDDGMYFVSLVLDGIRPGRIVEKREDGRYYELEEERQIKKISRGLREIKEDERLTTTVREERTNDEDDDEDDSDGGNDDDDVVGESLGDAGENNAATTLEAADVVLGGPNLRRYRGHPGNKNYRAILREVLRMCREEKSFGRRFVSLVADKVQRGSSDRHHHPPGRFLEHREDGKFFVARAGWALMSIHRDLIQLNKDEKIGFSSPRRNPVVVVATEESLVDDDLPPPPAASPVVNNLDESTIAGAAAAEEEESVTPRVVGGGGARRLAPARGEEDHDLSVDAQADDGNDDDGRDARRLPIEESTNSLDMTMFPPRDQNRDNKYTHVDNKDPPGAAAFLHPPPDCANDHANASSLISEQVAVETQPENAPILLAEDNDRSGKLYIEELAFLDHDDADAAPSAPEEGGETTALKPLPEAPRRPPDFPSENNTSAKWSFCEDTRVVNADFRGGVVAADGGDIPVGDRIFLSKLMQRDDLSVVTEGLLDDLNPIVWNLDYLARAVGTKMCHTFKRFDRKVRSGEVFYVEAPGYLSMKVSAFLRYLELRDRVLLLLSAGELERTITDRREFTFVDEKDEEHTVDVVDVVICMVDFDMPKHLPESFDDYRNFFRINEMLPGGKWCMMNKIPECGRPAMGPKLSIGPGGQSRFYQNGHGTVDSGHSVLGGYTEVIMLRRMPERHKRAVLDLLPGTFGTAGQHDGPDSAGGGLSRGGASGGRLDWPGFDLVDHWKQMNYYPSVFILKPGQHLHVNKGRLHAFRKLQLDAGIAKNDCHAKLRRRLVRSENLSRAPLCISVSYDWMYQGCDAEGINREVAATLECQILCRKQKRRSLAVPGTALLRMAQKLCPDTVMKKTSRRKMFAFENAAADPRTTSSCPEDLDLARGILPSLRHVVKEDVAAFENAKNRVLTVVDRPERCEKVSMATKPDAEEDPSTGKIDPYGADYFCRTCHNELANCYMHCDGCEKLISKDFNICVQCHGERDPPYARLIQVHPTSTRRHSTVNHTGDMPEDRGSRCPCRDGPSCIECGYCCGCSCRCHTWFTMRGRFFDCEQERNLLKRVEEVVGTREVRYSRETEARLTVALDRNGHGSEAKRRLLLAIRPQNGRQSPAGPSSET